MKPEEKLAAIDRRLNELKGKVKEYNNACQNRDELFEVKKKILLELKQIEKEIHKLGVDQLHIQHINIPFRLDLDNSPRDASQEMTQ